MGPSFTVFKAKVFAICVESTCQTRRPPPHPGGFPLTAHTCPINAVSARAAARFSKRKYSPRGFAPCTVTRNAVSPAGVTGPMV